MRPLTLIALAASLLVVSAASAFSSTGPELRLVAKSPLVVSGLHFKAREEVRVVVISHEGAARRVVASPDGHFTARFDDVVVSRCEPLSVRATGSRGSEAILKLPAPACLPVRSP